VHAAEKIKLNIVIISSYREKNKRMQCPRPLAKHKTHGHDADWFNTELSLDISKKKKVGSKEGLRVNGFKKEEINIFSGERAR
jgi:hypothetical protein